MDNKVKECESSLMNEILKLLNDVKTVERNKDNDKEYTIRCSKRAEEASEIFITIKSDKNESEIYKLLEYAQDENDVKNILSKNDIAYIEEEEIRNEEKCDYIFFVEEVEEE